MRKIFIKAVLIFVSIVLSLILKTFPGISAEFTMKCGTPGASTDAFQLRTLG